MKLLILTQKIDRSDAILGFFHGWVAAFAEHFDSITVIALGVGEYNLPRSVKVLSLGKESNASRVKYLARFYRFIWQERRNYDAVFVHMNQEYIILGGLFWRVWGKKIMMWRNHPKASFFGRLAVFLSDQVFCTSREAFVARFKKTAIMPVGINTLFYKREEGIVKKPNSILFLGRISPIKKPEIFIEALNLLNKEGVDFTASIVGDPLLKDADYYQGLKDLVGRWGLGGKIVFEKSINNQKTVEYYNRHAVYVNTTVSGSLDKTIFEAMSCESLVVASNRSLIGEIDDSFIFAENDAQDLASKIKQIITNKDFNKDGWGKKLREYIVKKHSLTYLVQKITNG